MSEALGRWLGRLSSIRTVYCARSVEPFLGSILTRSGCLTHPHRIRGSLVCVKFSGSLTVSATRRIRLERTQGISRKEFTTPSAQRIRPAEGSETLTVVGPANPGNSLLNLSLTRKVSPVFQNLSFLLSPVSKPFSKFFANIC
jgi:hypothetical protein